MFNTAHVTLNSNQSITVKIISLQNNADNRVKKCNEMIQSMRVIKLLAWESLLEKTIDQSRKAELWAHMNDLTLPSTIKNYFSNISVHSSLNF
jgi:hypothetical protein